jgi:hypothetical protein
MNYGREKISMKEQLEDAIEEIGGESLKASAGENESLQGVAKLVELAAHDSASRRPAT